MGILIGFQWFSPILPDPHWTVLALIGTIAPAIGFIILQDSIKENFKKIRIHRKKESGYGWTIVAIFSLIIVFFSYGFLGVEPTVISSGSMQPAINTGDIALVDEIDTSQIQIGDIIQIAQETTNGNIKIVHRVIDIYKDDKGQLFFITKGDANEDPDLEPVYYKNVLGKVIYTIPKLGWMQIYMNSIVRRITNPLTG
jgi:signal peptidase